MNNLDTVLDNQRDFFKSKASIDINFRKGALNKLKNLIILNEKEILDALNYDLGKSSFEGYSTEVGLILSEIAYAVSNLNKWSAVKKVRTPITNFKSQSYIYPEPFGNTLIISPWNYPFQLAFGPLIGAIAAGNTAIIKLSSTSVNTTRIIEEIINNNFDKGYLYVVTGEEGRKAIDKKFDYIFYTGSPSVGRLIMEKASKNLTPVTLELGGKSPCIVDCEGDLKLFAKRIVWGKFLNCGQTCIAPDYILVQRKIKDELINNMIYYIEEFYGKDPENNKEYGRIVNLNHLNRLKKLIEKSNIVYGGKINSDNLYFSPTILKDVTWDEPVMKEEIFGPILPILEYESLDEVIDIVNEHEKPLALYFFSNNEKKIQRIIRNTSYGGGCINDTIMHIANSNLPFGGVGMSGIGSYHGKKSFDTFTHYKSVLRKSTKIDINLRYPPYGDKLKFIKKVLK